MRGRQALPVFPAVLRSRRRAYTMCFIAPNPLANGDKIAHSLAALPDCGTFCSSANWQATEVAKAYPVPDQQTMFGKSNATKALATVEAPQLA